MSCYSYSSGDPIYFNPQNGSWGVEKVYTGGGPSYSYSMIARICEVANSDQICVYTRANSTSAETLLTEGLNYTFTANETITLVGNPNLGQIIIRRCTLNSKMLTTFTEGSKLSAKQLNIALHQLLFIAQEKEFIGSTNNHFYPLSTSIAAWNSGTNYAVGNYALQNGVVYQAIANNTNSQPPSANWTAVNFVTNGFIIQGGATLSGPVLFDLNGVTNGKTLIWQGSKFEAGIPSLNLDDLADVVITSPATNSVIRYNGTQWIDVPTFFDVSASQDMVLPGHIFSDKTKAPTSFTANAGNFPALTNDETTEMNTLFSPHLKDNDLNWNIPSVPTVMKMLNVMVPTYNPTKTFKQYMDFIKNNIDTFSANIGNPVKIKLHWNLSRRRINQVQGGVNTENTEENISGYKTAFWDDPKELYSTSMYTDIKANLNKYGLDNNGNVYLHGAYYAQETPSGQGATFYPKIWGYGIKRNGFYLSIPECYTSSLCNIPIFPANGGNEDATTTSPSTFYFTRADLGTNFETNVLAVGNLRNNRLTPIYRDTYLNAIREMCFAPSRGIPRTSAGAFIALNTTIGPSLTPFYNYYVDQYSRYMKSWLISADYSGWEDVSYRRLEFDGGVTGGVNMPVETVRPCLFKIPKNIIYYNKHALIQAGTGSAPFDYDSLDFSPTPVDGSSVAGAWDLSSTVRFQGTGIVNRKVKINTNDTIAPTAGNSIGYLYKANAYWEAWCKAWSLDPDDANGAKLGSYFNESDLDWCVSGLTYQSTASAMKLYNWQIGLPASGPIGDAANQANNYFPWPWRPGLFNRVTTAATGSTAVPSTSLTGDAALIHSSIGDHLYTLDYNAIFSTASNFVPDPVDEYVFRIVAKDSLTNLFSPVGDGSKPIPSTIIVEYGFSEDFTAGLDFPKDTFNSIYRKNSVYIESKDVWSRLDKSKVQVFVQNEQIENYTANNTTQKQYVINLCIRVPRLKSIGYSTLYRRPKTTYNNQNPADDGGGTLMSSFAWFRSSAASNAGEDPDSKNLGPWNLPPSAGRFGGIALPNNIGTTAVGGDFNPAYGERYGGGTAESTRWGNNSKYVDTYGYDYSAQNDWGFKFWYNNSFASGRCEAAVKFTRLGIPGNLWIKLSVLNTDGSLSLLTSGGAWDTQA